MHYRILHFPWRIAFLLLLVLAPVRAQADGLRMAEPDMPENPELGAKTEIPDKSPNALHFALSRQRYEEARLLLDSGVDVNVLGTNRDTPLHQACLAAPEAFIADLLARGACVNAREKTGLTPLHAAAFRGDPAIVRLLLDAGANPAIEDNNGHVAKDWAEWEHHDEAAAGCRPPGGTRV